MRNKQTIAVLLGIAAVVAGTLMLMISGADRASNSTDEKSVSDQSGAQPEHGGQDSATGRTESGRSPQSSDPTAGTIEIWPAATAEGRSAHGEMGTRSAFTANGSTSANDSIAQNRQPTATTADSVDGTDEFGREVAKPEPIGPPEWMAQVSDDEEKRIDKVFDHARALRHDPRINNRSRASSIESATQVVKVCYAALAMRQPGVQGRVIIGWTASAENGKGRITAPRIGANVGLRDESFETCITTALQDLPFSAEPGDPIQVEHPFFFESP